MLLLSKIQKMFTKFMFEWDQLFLCRSHCYSSLKLSCNIRFYWFYEFYNISNSNNSNNNINFIIIILLIF